MSITSIPLQPPDMAGKSDFRQQAEKKAALTPAHNICLSLKETRQLIHELRVHQIELEMQNEELRRVQAELDAARHRYFDLYDRAPVGYVTLTEANVIQDANFTASTLLGDTRSELLGNSISKFIPKGDQDVYYLFQKKLFKSAEPNSCEVRMVKGDGSTSWFHLTATITRNAAHEAVCRLAMVDITERKLAVEALRTSEVHMQAIIESTADGILAVDNKGNIIKANRRFAELWRIPESLLKSCDDKALLAFVLEQLSKPETFLEKVKSLYNSDASDMDTVIFKDGRIFERYSIPMLTGENIVGRVWSFRDITERKRVETELQAEKMNSEAMFESSPIALFVLDDKTNIVRVNGVAVILFGGNVAAALQHRPGNALGCVHSSEDPRGCGYSLNCPLCPVRNAIEALLKNGGEIQGANLPLDLVRDGVPQKVWVEVGAKPVQLNGQRHVCIAMIDITKRKQAEEAIVKQNNLFNTLLNNLRIGVYMVEVPSGKPLLENEAAFNLLGRGILPEVNASTLAKAYDVYKSDTNEPYPVEEMPVVAAMHGVAKHVDDMVVVKPDGTRVALDVYGSPIKDSQGNVWASLVSFQDISERKQAAEAVVRLAKTKNKFTSVVSHELRSPLATIKEATSLVLEGVLGPVNDAQKDMLNTAKSNIDRLGRLVNNVLTYQRIDAGKMQYDFQKNDVNEIVKEAHLNTMLITRERKADIVINLMENPPRISCDRDKIMQVLVNLISNGIKYSESGPVVIETRMENSEMRFSVKDEGQGIYPEEMESIFMPFSQGRGRKKGGTGLGLAISKEIVLAHRGKIWVESERDKGSTFYFTLPI